MPDRTHVVFGPIFWHAEVEHSSCLQAHQRLYFCSFSSKLKMARCAKPFEARVCDPSISETVKRGLYRIACTGFRATLVIPRAPQTEPTIRATDHRETGKIFDPIGCSSRAFGRGINKACNGHPGKRAHRCRKWNAGLYVLSADRCCVVKRSEILRSCSEQQFANIVTDQKCAVR